MDTPEEDAYTLGVKVGLVEAYRICLEIKDRNAKSLEDHYDQGGVYPNWEGEGPGDCAEAIKKRRDGWAPDSPAAMVRRVLEDTA